MISYSFNIVNGREEKLVSGIIADTIENSIDSIKDFKTAFIPAYPPKRSFYHNDENTQFSIVYNN